MTEKGFNYMDEPFNAGSQARMGIVDKTVSFV